MTRTVSESNLSTLAARARLKPRDKPYFRKIDIGLHLGYGKGTTPGGKWSLRKYLGAERYKRETLGIADDHVAADGVRVLSFAQAVRRALDRAAGPPIGPLTVAEAMEAYFERLEQKGKRAVEARARADRHIVKALGDRPVDSLTRDMLDLWLAGLVRGKDADAKRASQASANRILTILKAGLNQALKDKKAAPNDAWRHCEPFADVNKPRLRFFSMEESRRLLNAAQGDFRELCKAALFTGCRLSELTRLVAADFDHDGGTIYVAQSKSGKERRVHMSPEGRRFFEVLTAGRAGDSLMLTNGGKPWSDTAQTAPMTAAMRAASVTNASFHTWRKTHASHLVMAGVSIADVAENLGHADSRVTSRHYAHLSPTHRSEAMRKAPDFGTAEASTVIPLSGAR